MNLKNMMLRESSQTQEPHIAGFHSQEMCRYLGLGGMGLRSDSSWGHDFFLVQLGGERQARGREAWPEDLSKEDSL